MFNFFDIQSFIFHLGPRRPGFGRGRARRGQSAAPAPGPSPEEQVVATEATPAAPIAVEEPLAEGEKSPGRGRKGRATSVETEPVAGIGPSTEGETAAPRGRIRAESEKEGEEPKSPERSHESISPRSMSPDE